MKKSTLLFVLFAALNVAFISAQSGNTINDPIEVNGTNLSVDLINLGTASNSGLTPACSNSGDLFFKHTISSGENKFTFGMATAAVSLGTQIDFQLFKAPNGNMSNLEELTCDDYTIVILVGGSFEQVIENVNPGDDYYLRVFKPDSPIAALLTGLLNGTTITMASTFDSTLSIESVNQNEFAFIVKNNKIQFYNNSEYSAYKIFGLDGKQIISDSASESSISIDISTLSTGLYILMVQNEIAYKAYKFVKN